MARPLLVALTATAVLAVSLYSAEPEKKDKEKSQTTNATITHVDAQKGQITVKYTDEQGKAQEKTFRLTQDVKLLDETGRVVKIDVFESGNEALVVESSGKLQEVRRMPARRVRHISDAVRTLIEMGESDPACVQDLQKIYDQLRKLDTNKDGKIDAKGLKAEADVILQDRVKEILQHLDTNRDGKISKDEARGRIKEDFDKIDTNKDGFIDQAELLKAARERHEAKANEAKSAGKEKQ